MSECFPIVFALYPGVTQLDFTGPLEVFCRLPGAKCIFASEHGGQLTLAGGLKFSGLTQLSTVQACSLLCVPGGLGTIDALRSEAYIAQLARLGAKADTIVSVCTGSLLLGAAGLLQGKRAACHWAWRELLPKFGAVSDAARVVRDGNVTTGGGVTAGIDMALQVAADIAGIDFAESLQLALEYAPAPPFDSGRPELARPEILAGVQARMNASREVRNAAVLAAAARRESGSAS